MSSEENRQKAQGEDLRDETMERDIEREISQEVDRELEKLMAENGSGSKPKKKKRKKKMILGAAAVVILGVAGIKILGGQNEAAPAVLTVTPTVKTIENKLSVSGPVSGTDSVDVVSNLHAEILELSVKEGDKVEKGQVLAVLDDTDLRKEVEIARNDYELAVSTCAEQDKDAQSGYEKAVQDFQTAQANYDRTKVLFDGGSVPQVQLEEAQNALNDARRQRDSYTIKDGRAVADDSYRLQIEKARFDYEKTQEQLADTQITAPISGTVVRVNTKVGRFADTVENDQPLFVIENLDVLEMEIQVSEYSIGKVAVGQEAEISADILGGQPVRGQVVSISPTGEEKGGGSTERVIPTTVRILDSDTKLIAGITAKADIILESAEGAMTVPIASVLDDGEGTRIQTVKDGKIHVVPVTLGIEGDIEVQIQPQEGETVDETTQVVMTPNAGFYPEGMAVNAMPQ